MTRRERLLAIYRGEVPDRPAVRLWRAEPGLDLIHPAYEPVWRAALEKTDVIAGYGPRFDLYCGVHHESLFTSHEEPTESPEWVNHITELPAGDRTLRSVYRKSTCNKPGYEMENLLKESADLEAFLTLPYEPYPFSPDDYLALEETLGDSGIVYFGLDHAMYGLQRQIGSENFALWRILCPDLLHEGIALYARRLRAHVEAVLATGLRPVFGWVGPELCIPPLMSPADFDAFVFDYDKPLIDLIHDAGARVWVHCHGKMGPVLERFADMGVDVLNPLEPPPMGDITLAEAFGHVGDRMGLEGNIQGHDLMTATKDELGATIAEALEAGRGRRHILCICSSFMEDPTPSDRLIENTLFYVHEGVRLAEAMGA
jgi:uroporphyrinogen decarboxylase-like protein